MTAVSERPLGWTAGDEADALIAHAGELIGLAREATLRAAQLRRLAGEQVQVRAEIEAEAFAARQRQAQAEEEDARAPPAARRGWGYVEKVSSPRSFVA